MSHRKFCAVALAAVGALALTVLVVLGLFEFVFPWANATFHLSGEATV